MPRSVVDLSQLNALDAAIRAFDSNTGASMAAYQQSVSEMLAQFEAKLAELASIRDQRLSELRNCQYQQQFNKYLSCAFQAQAFYAANDRYRRCAELVRQARNAISEYESHASQFRHAKSELCSRARVGIDRVRATIEEYNSNPVPDTDNVMTDNVPINLTASYRNQNQSDDNATFMFASGVGSEKEKEGQPNILEHLPPVTNPDQEAIHAAAKDIAGSLGNDGATIGTKELLLQQKADAVFEQQYGISKTQLLTATGPQKNQYIDAYNRIQKGIFMELKHL